MHASHVGYTRVVANMMFATTLVYSPHPLHLATQLFFAESLTRDKRVLPVDNAFEHKRTVQKD